MNKINISIAQCFLFNRILLCAFLIILSPRFFAQPPQFKVYNYIEKYSQIAVKQMVEFKIPASVILAQAICESSSGTSTLAKKSNNHFGIKCHAGWDGDTTLNHDDSLNECFRRYSNIEESYTDHSVFLASRPRYAHLFKLSVHDYKSWCIGLKNAGYATSPDYAERLIKVIEETGLYELDGSENLTIEIRRSIKEPEIKESKYTGKGFSVRDFARAGTLWLDARQVPVKGLDFIVTTPKEISSYLAGN